MAKSNLSLLAYFLLVKSPLDTHTLKLLFLILCHLPLPLLFMLQSNDHLQCDSGALPSFRFFE